MIALTSHALGTILAVRAQPGAKRDTVLGERAGALRVAVSAAPEKGKANAAIQKLLAEALGCKASMIELIAGETSRDKKFLVSELSPEDLRARLESLIATLSTG